MLFRTGLCGIIWVATAATAMGGSKSVSPDLRQKAEAICYEDATRLCADSLVSDDAIIACMKGKRPQLTVPCRQVYDEVARALQ